jgi:hypothetical protein
MTVSRPIGEKIAFVHTDEESLNRVIRIEQIAEVCIKGRTPVLFKLLTTDHA